MPANARYGLFAPAGMTPDAFKAFLRKEIDRWKAVVHAANIKMD